MDSRNSRLRAFFNQRDIPNHQMERLRMRMLHFQFKVVHRNANVVREVDLLIRYNKFAQQFREQSTNSPVQTLITTLANQHIEQISAANLH